MKNAPLKLGLWILAGIVSVLFLIITGSNSYALGFFLVALIYVVVPCLLLSIRDVVVAQKIRGRPRSSWLIFHICAAFAAVIGWGLWRMAVASEHPMADKHFELIFILPALVYLVPVALTLYATAVVVIKDLIRQSHTPHDPSAKSKKEL